MLPFLVEHYAVIREAMAIVILSMIACLTQRWHARLRTAKRGLGRIARHHGLSAMLVGLLALGASATLSLLGRMPEPESHDEFSYLLAADTFAHGRLTNPTHPLWVHFESFHIIQQPTYAAKYPPGQGLMLAAGQVLGGHPIVGVWISTALACAAIYWMLLAWSPPGWALLGGVLTALHPGILLRWGQSYWGGAVAMMGGALVFGALRRVLRRPRVRDALLLGLGFAILANSRPYEGLVVSLPAAAVLFAWMLGKNRPTAWVSIRSIVMPTLVILIVTGGAMAFYNWRVTGSALRLPYQVDQATYAVAPVFVWQHPWPEPSYRHEVMRKFYTTGWVLDDYTKQRTVPGLVRAWREKLKTLWFFYQWDRRLRLVLTIPLVMLPWVVRHRWERFALLTCGVLTAGLLMETWSFPHYAAPMIGLVVVLVVQGMRYLRMWRWRGKPTGRWLVWAVVVVALASFGVHFAQQLQDRSHGWQFERARILHQLQAEGGRHLVVVRYGPLHSPHHEWVYNAADIDGAQVVWAREMDLAQTRQLLTYFKDRHVWLAQVDRAQVPPTLVPYPGAPRA